MTLCYCLWLLAGPPSLRSAYPPGFEQVGSIGDSVSFHVSAWSYPPAEFQWKHTLDSGTSVNLPSDDMENHSNLTILIEGEEDYGSYHVVATNQLGQWDDVIFTLIPEGEIPQVISKCYQLQLYKFSN